MFIAERIIHSVREEEQTATLKEAADSLYEDYKNDPNLTAFTSLDYEEFYETR
ncbi:hypothetical protein TREAZ_0063 [Leadbettera azotonutricia ZAS-9]|uniref:Uncharacterized protein n=2 Tax=Leadbettera azotonutricia TaxID=150829 RepID=F5YFL4_LEAAZ|nr:hypothetical protein TREAZ_0063 [Leadbettera azotonutricia ZAS-9]